MSTQTPEETKETADISGIGKRFSIPGDVVNKATAHLEDEQRSAIRWLHSYGSEYNLTLQEIASKLKRKDGAQYDANTIYKVLTGRHDAGLDNIVESILDFKKIQDQRATIKRIGFVKTKLSKRIWDICETALIYQRMIFIFGPSQIGKSTATEEYARAHNHGETVFVRMPAGGAMGSFCYALAKVLRIGTQNKLADLRRRLVDAFDNRMLLIVDEGHQVFLTSQGRNRLETLEFIREIHDLSKCGVVICATNALDKQIQSGPWHDVLEQFDFRSLCTLRLPDKPSRTDLDAFAIAYGLDTPDGDAAELEKQIIANRGLGQWCAHLQAGSRIAAKRGQKLGWQHVLMAHASIKHLGEAL